MELKNMAAAVEETIVEVPDFAKCALVNTKQFKPTRRVALESLDVLFSKAAEVCQFFSHLSNDLRLLVLSYLHFADLFRLRATCRSFDNLLRSEAFWKELPSDCNARKSCHFLLMVIPFYDYRADYLTLEDLFLHFSEGSNNNNNKVISAGKVVPLLKICEYLSVIDKSVPAVVPAPYTLFRNGMVASSGGLLCLTLADKAAMNTWINPSRYDYELAGVDAPVQNLVVNLLTGSSHLVPPSPQKPSSWPAKLFTLVFETDATSSPPSYFIALVCGNFRSKIYHSRTGAWTLAGQQRDTQCLRGIQNAHIFHYRVGNQAFLYGYDAESCVWWRLKISKPYTATCLDIEVLYRYKGRIFYIVAPFLPADSPHHKGLIIWELKQTPACGTCSWVELTRTPARCLCKVSEWGKIIAFDGLVYGVHYPGGWGLPPQQPHQPLVYDIDRNFWYILPKFKHNAKAYGDVVAI